MKLTQHKTIEQTNVCPFPDSLAYLYIESDNGFSLQAYDIDENAPLDLLTLLQEVFPDCLVAIETRCVTGSPNYAAIITDGKTPESAIVWSSCDFFLDIE